MALASSACYPVTHRAMCCQEGATHDTLTHVRSKTCRIAFDLLKDKAEQEAATLFLLVFPRPAALSSHRPRIGNVAS
eukprot:1567711-Rhodomonas_salina.1